MKTSIRFIVTLLVLTLPCSALAAGFTVPHITVFGTAETEVAPDKLLWSTTLKSVGGSVSDVAAEHAKEVAKILDYLFSSGLTAEVVKTSQMQLQNHYVYRNNSRLKDGFYALTQISFETSEFDSYLDYWKKLSMFNNLTINNVSFSISNYKEIQDKTRIAAVLKAKEKAIDLANAIGSRLVEPLLIEEVENSFSLQRNEAVTLEMSGGSRTQNPISAGNETVQSSVKAIFRITAD